MSGFAFPQPAAAASSPAATPAAARGGVDFVTMNVGAHGFEKHQANVIQVDLERLALVFTKQAVFWNIDPSGGRGLPCSRHALALFLPFFGYAVATFFHARAGSCAIASFLSCPCHVVAMFLP